MTAETAARTRTHSVRIGIDIGGTFTDVVLEQGTNRYTAKTLTTTTAPERAVLHALRDVLTEAKSVPADVGLIIHGTTLATNALIERKGAPTALITTQGFRDVVEMGTESRFEQYDLNIVKPRPLIARRLRFPVPERLSATGDVLLPLDTDAVDALVPVLLATGIKSLAIGFMHSFVNPAHELATAERLERKLPGISISLSSQVSPEIREYERISTTCANAYLQPLIAGYIQRLERALVDDGYRCPLFMMLSNGGITLPETAKRFPVRLIESGPAGGAILAAHIAEVCSLDSVVSFDMGGTTAKICLIDDAVPQTTRQFEVARVHRFKQGSGLPMRIPVVEMVEIGAGGGSISKLDPLRRIQVGPQSAGADPGPACYARGGKDATVTDANVVLGRIGADGFAGGDISLNSQNAARAIDAALAGDLGHPTEFAALGITEIVDENMANAAREHATENGKTLSGRTLIAFGGSAPIHAARIAEKLNIEHVIVPVGAGVGSAVGFLRAPVAYEVSRSAYQRLAGFDPSSVNTMFSEMSQEAQSIVIAGAPGAQLRERRIGYMRYVGQGHEIAVPIPVKVLQRADGAALREVYDDVYRSKYGQAIAGVDVEVMNWTLSVTAPTAYTQVDPSDANTYSPRAECVRRVFLPGSDNWLEAACFTRARLRPGATIVGPALIVENQTTTVVTGALTARLNAFGDIVMHASTSD